MSPSNPWRHPPGVPRCEKPRAEGRFYLPGGRRIGYAEYGDPSCCGVMAPLGAAASCHWSAGAQQRSLACASS
jgi:hypothetical protein